MKLKNLIIFDLDGVITSEEAYWDCAGLTLHELLYSPRYWHVSTNEQYRPAASALDSRTLSRATLPEWLLLSFKSRALNSNWDTAYAAICLHLVDLLNHLPERAALLPVVPGDMQWIARLRTQIAAANLAQTWSASQLQATWHRQHPFDLPIFRGVTGLELFARLDIYASQTLELPVEGVFARNQPFWRFCQNLFQEWLLGETVYTRTYGHQPAQPEKPGCLFFEEPLLPPEEIRATLETLRARGYTLGVASGRVLQEATEPLKKYGLLDYFDQQHMGTYDMVIRGEKALRARRHAAGSSQYPQTEQGQVEHPALPLASIDDHHADASNTREPGELMLGKPHPFHFQAAADWHQALQNALQQPPEPLSIPFIAVGDSTSDILSGRAAGALTVAVLTGARTAEARELFLRSLPDFVIEDMTGLPALLDEIENLATIQKLQFTRREVAEKLLRLWFARQMQLTTEHVRLTPRAVSLNSFNGFYISEGQEYFFKTHIEEHGVLNEYYHAELLDRAGYNVVRPLRLLREKERQMVIYPVITAPVMFDLVRALETGQELPAEINAETLLEAERAACRRLLEIYAHTLQPMRDTSAAPIHQLFWHRLTKRHPEFYAQQTFPLPGTSRGTCLSYAQLLHARWIINGEPAPQSLDELVTSGQRVLDPRLASASVIGHGDAHFGNVFLQKERTERYLYFDPAFAGRHSPLLDIVKPFFHNVFATWMYFPHEVAQDLHLVVHIEGEQIIVEHDYHLTPIRRALLQVKQEELLTPLLAWLEEAGALPSNWQEILRLALMCCPLLTVNLFDETRRPSEIGWLGLTQAIQFGNGGIAAWKER